MPCGGGLLLEACSQVPKSPPQGAAARAGMAAAAKLQQQTAKQIEMSSRICCPITRRPNRRHDAAAAAVLQGPRQRIRLAIVIALGVVELAKNLGRNQDDRDGAQAAEQHQGTVPNAAAAVPARKMPSWFEVLVTIEFTA